MVAAGCAADPPTSAMAESLVRFQAAQGGPILAAMMRHAHGPAASRAGAAAAVVLHPHPLTGGCGCGGKGGDRGGGGDMHNPVVLACCRAMVRHSQTLAPRHAHVYNVL